MRYLGIDYGTKKVGLALSDEAGRMGFPHGTLPNDGRLIDEVLALITRKEVGAVVMGESRDFAGNENAVAKDAKQFAQLLERRSGIIVSFEPEMLDDPRGPPGLRGRAAAGKRTRGSGRLRSCSHTYQLPKPRPAMISIDEFSKIEVKVGTVLSSESVPETDKLLRLVVDFGEEGGPRQIVSGIRTYAPEPEALVGRQLAFVTNLEPRIIKGLESNGMLFAVGEGETFAFLTPDRPVPPGTGAH